LSCQEVINVLSIQMWMSLKDVSTIPIKMYPTGRDKDPIRIWNDILVGCLARGRGRRR